MDSSYQYFIICQINEQPLKSRDYAIVLKEVPPPLDNEYSFSL
jgi:hypothetical protein